MISSVPIKDEIIKGAVCMDCSKWFGCQDGVEERIIKHCTKHNHNVRVEVARIYRFKELELFKGEKENGRES